MKYAASIFKHIGRRGATLLFWSFILTVSGLRFATGNSSPSTIEGVRVILMAVDISVIGWLFLGTGIFMVLAAFVKPLEDVAFFLSAFCFLFWGMGWLTTHYGDPWIWITQTIVWFALAAKMILVAGWRENWERVITIIDLKDDTEEK